MWRRHGAPTSPPPTVEGDRVTIAAGARSSGAAQRGGAPAHRGRAALQRPPGLGRRRDRPDVPPVAGRVLEVKAGVGEHITPGQILAVISAPDYGQAQADARDADGAVELAQRTLARARDLYEHGAGPKKDVDAAEEDMARARAEQQRTQAKLRLYGGADATVDELLRLRSPIGGTVAERSVAVGQEVRPDQMMASDAPAGKPLFVITDPTRLWAWLDVSEVDLATLQPGETFSLEHGRLSGSPLRRPRRPGRRVARSGDTDREGARLGRQSRRRPQGGDVRHRGGDRHRRTARGRRGPLQGPLPRRRHALGVRRGGAGPLPPPGGPGRAGARGLDRRDRRGHRRPACRDRGSLLLQQVLDSAAKH